MMRYATFNATSRIAHRVAPDGLHTVCGHDVFPDEYVELAGYQLCFNCMTGRNELAAMVNGDTATAIVTHTDWTRLG
jgi:hypothetical protein